MTGMGGVNLGLFVPPMKDDLGFGQTVFGLAQTARLVGFSVTGWLVGRYLDRFGARLPLIVAGLIMGFSVAAVSLIDAGWQMVVLFLIGGMTGLQGQGANLYSTVPIARWFQRKRGKAFSLTFLGISVGIFVLSPLSQFLIDNVGWRDTWLIMAVMGTIVTILVAVLIIRRQPDDGPAARRLRRLLRVRRLRLLRSAWNAPGREKRRCGRRRSGGLRLWTACEWGRWAPWACSGSRI